MCVYAQVHTCQEKYVEGGQRKTLQSWFFLFLPPCGIQERTQVVKGLYTSTSIHWRHSYTKTNQPKQQLQQQQLQSHEPFEINWKLSAVVYHLGLMGARKMAQWVEALDAKPKDLNSISGIENVHGGSWEPIPQTVC